MNTSLASLSKSKGSVLVLTALSLFVIMGMLGLGIDLGNAYVNKTRLQNALDAMALSAAISLVNERPLGQVVTDARNTFNTYGLSSVNSTTDIDICFFNNYNSIDSSCNITTPTASSKFVRVTNKQGHLLSVATTFASIIGFPNTNISASAVSGPLALKNSCDLVPLLTCSDMTTIGPGPDGIAGNVDDARTPTDTNCDDNNNGAEEPGDACYGYTIGHHYTLKVTDWTDTTIGSGNFGLMDVGAGGRDICEAMAGGADCRVIDPTEPVPSETGNAAGPTTCLNIRFDDHTHGNNLQQFPIPPYNPDTNIHEYPSSATDPSQFSTYKNDAGPPSLYPPANSGVADKRIIHLPLVDCADGLGHGGVDLDLQTMGCFLITKKVPYGGEPNQFEVFAEFVGVNKSGLIIDPKCEIASKPAPNSVVSPFAPNRVVLFKDPVSHDA